MSIMAPVRRPASETLPDVAASTPVAGFEVAAVTPIAGFAGRAVFPWRGVVAPWLGARVVTSVLLVVAAPLGWVPGNLLDFDGAWFRRIVNGGYGTRPPRWPPIENDWTRFPFFPLYPGLARAVHALGVPTDAALVAVAWAGALVATAGVYRIARRHVPQPTAVLAAWLCGLLPGSITLGMAYSDSWFLAGSTWAVCLAEERRWRLAAVAALVATAARPNGVFVLITLAVLVVTIVPDWGTRFRTLVLLVAPSAAFLGAWMWMMDRWAGDPLAFLTAKEGWAELTLAEMTKNPLDRNAAVHLVLGLAAILVALAVADRMPRWWLVQVAVFTVPSVALGITGLARYAALAFPVPVALAALGQRVWPFRSRPMYRLGSAVMVLGAVATLTAFSVTIVRMDFVP